MALDEPTSSGPPSAYFPAVGDAVVVGIVDVGTYQQRDYDTGELKTWPDGGKVEGKVVTGLVISHEGTTAKGGQRNSQPIEAGDLVTFWCEGGKHYTYRDALAQHGAVDVGDVMLWKREADKPPTNPRHNPAKQYVARIRKPKPDDGDVVDRCQKARNELKAARIDEAPADPVYASASYDADVDAF